MRARALQTIFFFYYLLNSAHPLSYYSLYFFRYALFWLARILMHLSIVVVISEISYFFLLHLIFSFYLSIPLSPVPPTTTVIRFVTSNKNSSRKYWTIREREREWKCKQRHCMISISKTYCHFNNCNTTSCRFLISFANNNTISLIDNWNLYINYL